MSVILWPAGLALVLVWMIFRDPAIDYRLVVVGALLPDLIDAPFGGARVMHTVVASVVLLVGVMLATRHRRQARRRLLAVPIGTFLHLVLDGMWTRTETFWWPFLGRRLDGGLPPLDRPLAVLWCRSWPAPPPWPGCGGSGTWQTRRSGATSGAPAVCRGRPGK